MNQRLRILLVPLAMLTTATPVWASGSKPAAANQSFDRARFNHDQNATSESMTLKAVADEPYDLGKEVFAGKYKLGHPTLTKANTAEKLQRLQSLRRALPAAERSKIDPALLSQRLTNREMNDLEYYLGMRFGKFITVAPSWAKSEPPPKAVSAR